MLVKLSSKGQLVIPQSIRRELGLCTGTRLYVQLDGDKIILEPIDLTPPIDALYARYPKDDFRANLEKECRQELHDEPAAVCT